MLAPRARSLWTYTVTAERARRLLLFVFIPPSPSSRPRSTQPVPSQRSHTTFLSDPPSRPSSALCRQIRWIPHTVQSSSFFRQDGSQRAASSAQTKRLHLRAPKQLSRGRSSSFKRASAFSYRSSHRASVNTGVQRGREMHISGALDQKPARVGGSFAALLTAIVRGGGEKRSFRPRGRLWDAYCKLLLKGEKKLSDWARREWRRRGWVETRGAATILPYGPLPACLRSEPCAELSSVQPVPSCQLSRAPPESAQAAWTEVEPIEPTTRRLEDETRPPGARGGGMRRRSNAQRPACSGLRPALRSVVEVACRVDARLCRRPLFLSRRWKRAAPALALRPSRSSR